MKLDLTDTVRRMQAGDPAAFPAFYQQTQQFIYYTALKLLGSPADAEDATQAVYLKIWENIHTLKDPQSAPKWVKTVTFNACYNELTQQKRRVSGLDEGEVETQGPVEDDIDYLPQEALDREATRAIILQMIDSLPEKQRVTVYLYYFDELRVEEIAQLLAVSPGTVKSRLNSARLKIREAVLAEEKRGNKLYAMPVLLLRLLEMDARQYQPRASLTASILAQAPGAQGPGAPPQGGGSAGASNPPPLGGSGPADPAAPPPSSPGALSGARAARAGLGSAAKWGVGLGAGALVVAAALLLRGGPADEPALPPTTAGVEVPGTPPAPTDQGDAAPAGDEDQADSQTPAAPEGPAAALPPTGGLTYTDAFDDGAGYVHVVLPSVPQDVYTMHLYAAPSITEEQAAETIAAWEANQGWGNQWMPNSAMGNEGGSYAASLRHPEETGGNPFDLLVASFDASWHAVSYDILHVNIG